VKRPAPVTAALAVSLGISVDLASRTALTADLHGDRLSDLFRCPAQSPPGRGYSLASSDWEAPDEFSGYDFNEALLSHRLNAPWLPQGELSRVRTPARVFFAMDGNSRERFFHIWEVNRQAATLRQVRDQQDQCIDYTRHACRANVLFADWHVESVPLTSGGLESIEIDEGP
jgi:prepilin-type processing-associated H-X9-DG protein